MKTKIQQNIAVISNKPVDLFNLKPYEIICIGLAMLLAVMLGIIYGSLLF